MISILGKIWIKDSKTSRLELELLADIWKSVYTLNLDLNNMLYHSCFITAAFYGGFEFVEYLLMSTFEFNISYGKRKQYWLFIVYVECPQFVQQYQRHLPFLSEKRVIDRATKLMCTICNKKLYMSN